MDDSTLTQDEIEEVYCSKALVDIRILAQMIKIIELGQNRNIFKVEEMSTIGGLWDILHTAVTDALEKKKKERFKKLSLNREDEKKDKT